jgi:hypothetical protein
VAPYLQKKLVELCGFDKEQKWKLKYRGTIDGFKASDFHGKCDGIANTLTVIKADNGNIFGGYAEKEWNSREEDITDPSAFIFSLRNMDANPFKMVCPSGGQFSISCQANCGPIIGGDVDESFRNLYLVIISDSNTEKGSFCDFEYAYQHPDYLQETPKANSILAGIKYFQAEEIEVFTKIH